MIYTLSPDGTRKYKLMRDGVEIGIVAKTTQGLAPWVVFRHGKPQTERRFNKPELALRMAGKEQW